MSKITLTMDMNTGNVLKVLGGCCTRGNKMKVAGLFVEKFEIKTVDGMCKLTMHTVDKVGSIELKNWKILVYKYIKFKMRSMWNGKLIDESFYEEKCNFVQPRYEDNSNVGNNAEA